MNRPTDERKKPIIGVTGPDIGGTIIWRFTQLAIFLSGGKALRITPEKHFPLDYYDGFIISGGSDINPELYGEAAPLPSLQYDTERDQLEIEVVRHADGGCKPLLGICRGMQLINVVRGGSLYQEASEILDDFLPNRSLISKIIGRRKVIFDQESRLYNIMGRYDTYNVNSIHHQAVNIVGANLKVVAREENGLIQAIETEPSLVADASNNITPPHQFVTGVQWHPEFMLHVASARRLFKAVVKAARVCAAQPSFHKTRKNSENPFKEKTAVVLT
jgi:putative glutamine amidotransferase